MDPHKTDPPKLPDMVMCGDHPSITKTELNVKEEKFETKTELEKPKDRPPMSYARISPTSSRTDKPADLRTDFHADLRTEFHGRETSEHAMRMARRRVRSMEAVRPADIGSGNRVMVQEKYSVMCAAALGSFRWPPYLVGVWVLVLLLTHILHCLVAVLDSAMPNLRKFCQYLRSWTEECWKTEGERSRVCPIGLACLTGLMYAFYFGLFAVHALAVWAVEPLCDDDKREDVETKVINYIEDVNSKTNSSLKQT